MLLRVENVTKAFDGVKALESLSFQIEKGTITAIVGPNGSGKTTLFNVICGFLAPDTGEVAFKGKNITCLAPQKIARTGIGRTFQMIRIFPQIRVMENMLLALETDKKEGLFCAMNPFGKYSSRSLEEKARKMLSLVELEKESDKYAGELSHGNRRLLEVLRTIALDADLFLFDEPTAGVFSEIKTRILELFRRLISQGKTVIFVEHNMDTVREAAERVIVLHKGKILADGRPESVLESQPVVEAYFGG